MKHLLLVSTFLILFFGAFAQKGERIESLKIAHLSGKLNLDPKTAERFWPLYNQYESEMQQIVLEKRRMNQNDTRSADEILDQEQKAIDLKRKYNAQFLKVIDNNQLNQMYQAEKEFRQMIIKRSQRMDNNPVRENRRMNQNPEQFNHQGPGRRMQAPSNGGRNNNQSPEINRPSKQSRVPMEGR
jgi:hypothetical protein